VLLDNWWYSIPRKQKNTPSRRRKAKEIEVEERKHLQTPQVQVTREKTTKKTSTKRKTGRSKKHDIDKLFEEAYEPMLALLSLTDDLSLPEETSKQIVREIVEMIASEYSSKPSIDAILKKAKRNIRVLYEYVVSKLLETLDKPTPEQLEYIVSHGSKTLIPEIGKLYRLALTYKREDLIEQLRHIWNTHGPKGMVECPKCKFNAITPENSCSVCGHVVTEEYIRRALSFTDKFELYVKTASVAELNEVLRYGYVLVGEKGVYYPRSPRARLENNVVYPIYLISSEISKITEEINSRELQV